MWTYAESRENENLRPILEFNADSMTHGFRKSVIIAVKGLCAQFDETKREMTLAPYLTDEQGEQSIPYNEIGKVLEWTAQN
jgi:hypothetical protein